MQSGRTWDLVRWDAYERRVKAQESFCCRLVRSKLRSLASIEVSSLVGFLMPAKLCRCER